MGLFDFFKKKSAQPVGQVIVPIPVEREQSSKPVQIDEYVQERGRILSILADQAMQFLDSRAAIHLAYFLKQTTELNSDYAKASLIGCCDKAHHTETATTLFLVKIKDCLKFRTFSWT